MLQGCCTDGECASEGPTRVTQWASYLLAPLAPFQGVGLSGSDHDVAIGDRDAGRLIAGMGQLTCRVEQHVQAVRESGREPVRDDRHAAAASCPCDPETPMASARDRADPASAARRVDRTRQSPEPLHRRGVGQGSAQELYSLVVGRHGASST